ncbi:PREDICTED: uncharacterized protein LOC104753143 [Camelina sativa]|uniref:Uncharacterized protein LOC104753143 n=1 Tax=Camelina sativa TaxID=90675 RepID=A0ABM0WNP4_CAMSA|nr:PREDICTED: uncharacterized protein LOC104753143 [Camelina sativa]
MISSYSSFALKQMDPYLTGSVLSEVREEVDESVGLASISKSQSHTEKIDYKEAERTPVTVASRSSVPPASQTLLSQLSEAEDVLFAAASGPPEVPSNVSEAEPAPVTAASGSSQGSEVGASDKQIIRNALTEYNDVLDKYQKLSQIAIDNETDNEERKRRVDAVKDAVNECSKVVNLVLKKGHPVEEMKNCQKILEGEVSILKRQNKRFEKNKKRNSRNKK